MYQTELEHKQMLEREQEVVNRLNDTLGGKLQKTEEPSNHIDMVIKSLFSSRWSGDLRNGSIEDMREQLAKTLRDQMAGYWSGHTAYHIAVDGGFLIDSKRDPIEDSNMAKGKRLTEIGKLFMSQYA
jgi:hypothetical protein